MRTPDPEIMETLPGGGSATLPARADVPRQGAARLVRALATTALRKWRVGRLTVHLPDGTTCEGGPPGATPDTTLWVHRERMLWQFALRGDVGIGESYVNGDWHADDLPRFIELALLNQGATDDTWLTRLATLPDLVGHARRRNTRHGSRRNIGQHYDLSNDLFALFLDPGLTYSSAVFDRPDEPLEAAQQRKFARFGDWLRLGPDDHVLEIGCGWGACAIYLAQTYGCRVTGLTISRQQYALATRRVHDAGLSDRVDIRFCDYRDVTGRYSHIVSIEMLEAVGREHWATFFDRCHAVLAPGGLLGIQVIAIPDHRFDTYARRCDWIQKYIFPGGILPSLGELTRVMSVRAPFTVRRLDDIGLHYAETLARWRRTFLARTTEVRRLGMDDRFIRTWEYYLASCEGAFRARAIGNLQLVLGRALVAALLCWAAVPSAAPPQPATIAARNPPSLFETSVSDAALRATVRDLVAMGPRRGGTASGHAAADYIARAFRALGLTTRIVTDPDVPAYEADRWEVRVGEERLASAWPYTFSPPIDPPRTGTLETAPAGGATSSPPDGDRVTFLEPWSVAGYRRLTGGPRRPVAILTSGPPAEGRDPDAAPIEEVPGGPEAPTPVFGISPRDAERVTAAAASKQATTVGLVARVGRGSPHSVIATLPGRSSDRYYLVSAHADSDGGGPGADDNASGVAVVLEVARLLTEAASAGHVLPFTIRFVTWGEEYGSARAYLEREGAGFGRCLGVLNIDQAGTGAEREAVYAEGNDVPWNGDLLRDIEAVGRDRAGAAGLWPEFATTPTQGGTDAYAFLPPRYKGSGPSHLQVPAVTIYTAAWGSPGVLRQTPGWSTNVPGPNVVIDYSRYYHSSADTPGNTTEREPQNMRRVVQLIGLTLERLARTAP